MTACAECLRSENMMLVDIILKFKNVASVRVLEDVACVMSFVAEKSCLLMRQYLGNRTNNNGYFLPSCP